MHGKDSSILWEELLEPGATWSHVLKRGTSLRLTDMEGGANVSALLFNFECPAERYNMPDTLKAQHIAWLAVHRPEALASGTPALNHGLRSSSIFRNRMEPQQYPARRVSAEGASVTGHLARASAIGRGVFRAGPRLPRKPPGRANEPFGPRDRHAFGVYWFVDGKYDPRQRDRKSTRLNSSHT